VDFWVPLFRWVCDSFPSLHPLLVSNIVHLPCLSLPPAAFHFRLFWDQQKHRSANQGCFSLFPNKTSAEGADSLLVVRMQGYYSNLFTAATCIHSKLAAHLGLPLTQRSTIRKFIFPPSSNMSPHIARPDIATSWTHSLTAKSTQPREDIN
jgi:hypothetical protein